MEKTFKPRLDPEGIWQNPLYYSQSPFNYAYEMPNCTAYAWGRFYEISGEYPKLSVHDAEDWFPENAEDASYPCGQVPALGAVACWKNGRGGHVAIVEVIDGNKVTISESGYQRPLSDYPPAMSNYFWFEDIDGANPRCKWMGSEYEFQGFIYNPAIPVPLPKADTYTLALKSVQSCFDVLPSGAMDNATKEFFANHLTSYGDTGSAVRLMQVYLSELGYSLAPYGADGIFLDITLSALYAFQADAGLDVDGLCGWRTWDALCKRL